MNIPPMNAEHVARYKGNLQTRNPKWHPVIRSVRKNDGFLTLMRVATYFEFSWGFALEYKMWDQITLSLYPIEALDQGIEQFQERFLTAYVDIVRPDLRIFQGLSELLQSPCLVGFQDGRLTGSAFSLSATGDEIAHARFRSWVADRLLSSLVFEVLCKVMDSEFQFPKPIGFLAEPGNINSFHSF